VIVRFCPNRSDGGGGFRLGWCGRDGLRDLPVAGIFDSRGDGGADGGQVGGPAAGAVGGGVFAECDVLDVVMCLDGGMSAGEPGKSGGSWFGRAHLGSVNDALNVPVDEVAAAASWRA